MVNSTFGHKDNFNFRRVPGTAHSRRENSSWDSQLGSTFHREVLADYTMNLLKEVTINLWFDRKANSSILLAGMIRKSLLMKKLIRFYLIE